MSRLNHWFLEPVNTITHLFGAIVTLIGLLILLILTRDEPGKMLTLFIYGFSQFMLYAASCLLHGVHTTPKWSKIFNRIDHMAIFLMIAGAYTPVAYNLFPDPWRIITLIVVWSAAFVGMFFKLVNQKIHGFFNASIYVILSWGAALPLMFVIDVTSVLSWTGIVLLVIGGIIYTVGFVVYYLEKPDPWPNVFGHHEIWHLFVLGGSFFHYLFMLWIVVPFSGTA